MSRRCYICVSIGCVLLCVAGLIGAIFCERTHAFATMKPGPARFSFEHATAFLFVPLGFLLAPACMVALVVPKAPRGAASFTLANMVLIGTTCLWVLFLILGMRAMGAQTAGPMSGLEIAAVHLCTTVPLLGLGLVTVIRVFVRVAPPDVETTGTRPLGRPRQLHVPLYWAAGLILLMFAAYLCMT